MKFDICVGNPPYEGNVDPLYMRIIKMIYDSVLKKDGIMCVIHPTGLVDNKFEGSDYYDGLKKKYSYIKLLDFIYESGTMGVFTSIKTSNDLGIFIYGKNGEYNIFDNHLKGIRFGENYFKDKEIVDTIQKKTPKEKRVGYYNTFNNIQFGNTSKTKIRQTKYINSQPVGDNYVVCSYNHGSWNKTTGERYWDWATLMSGEELLVKNKLPYKSMNIVNFKNDRNAAINLIKWLNTDFVNFLVMYYKSAPSNSAVLFQNIPQPPTYGDFSDKTLMDKFGLTSEQMEHIHKSMIGFGFKTRDYVVADHKESSLLQFIEDLNSGKVELPDIFKKKKPTFKSKNKDTVDPEDSSPSGSEPSKTVLDN